MATTRYDEEEQRRRKPASLAPRAGIAPSGMPGVPGVPARPAPAAGGIAPPPKYGGMDYMRADGSRRIVDEEGDRNVVTVPGAGPVEVPSSTPMSVTPNRESGITAASPAVSEFDPRAGEVRTAPATGAQVQMPAEAWRRYDAANAARRAGIAPQLPAEPGDQPGGTNAYARAAGLFAASTQRPGMVSEGGGRLAEIQKQREAEMDRSRYGLMRPGATSANNRAWDAARRDDARAADRRSMVEGQQSVEREGHQLAAAASVAGSLFKSQAEQAAAREARGAARDVAGRNLEGVKYKADKDAETELSKSERDLAARREEWLDKVDLKRREMDRQAGADGAGITDSALNDYIKLDAPAIRAYRIANLKTYDPDPARNEQMRKEAVHKVVLDHYGENSVGRPESRLFSRKSTEVEAAADAADAFMERMEELYGPYVDLQDERFGVPRGAPAANASGARQRPGGKYRVDSFH